MSWFRSLLFTLALCIATVMTIDVAVYFIAPGLGKSLNPNFANSAKCSKVGKGYPRYHFAEHPDRGFDITPKKHLLACGLPLESPPYEVWGNAVGCFDREIDFSKRYAVYLAGDSFTWGYAPFEKKFGVLLERDLGQRILKCGVSHTGQRHQFDKFIEVSSKLGHFPKVVIINYTDNDIENDFAFPHTRVLDGYFLEDTFLKRTDKGELAVTKLSVDQLRGKIAVSQEQSRRPLNQLRDFFMDYSASMLVLRSYVKLLRTMVQGTKPNDAASGPLPFYSLLKEVPNSTEIKRYPIESTYALANRQALKRWHQHSIENNYKLIVSLILSKHNANNSNWYDDVEEFFRSSEITFYNFAKYLSSEGIPAESIYWQHNAHFNVEGNRVYARHLGDVLRNLRLDE